MDDGYHSDWHRIWVAAMAARYKYESRSLSQRVAFGSFLAMKDSLASEAKKYSLYNWNKAVRNGETCPQCGDRPKFVKGKTIF
jgi:hypothetical protein